ncbi:small multidrug resistance protein [Lactobacillus ultunensis DSM 16047]|uniref:Multidrug resistance protein, SMR family n=2 Tax=Lactobacillus ultunensis TaxID=227945 RepID=C2ENH5_9LACO|nr:multidrug resistance protein, SMR family [Lactobacillus ultunensis DSM 16047]KRL81995.1 small multidrug resistance protein [Lactobacillus ultunensis DSM 16047]
MSITLFFLEVKNMTWIYLILAGLCEVWWATTMKLSNGFHNVFWSIITVIGMIASFWGLIVASKHLPIGIAYPVWTGIGAVGSVIISVILFHNQMNWVTWVFVILLIISIIGIKISAR